MGETTNKTTFEARSGDARSAESIMPLCSVIIPTHQRRERLLRTLATVQAQTYDPLEIVVVVDGSTDGSTEAIALLEDPRIVVVDNTEPVGVAAARNQGVEAATGDWVAFCDDDDLWAPEKIAEQVRAVRTTSAPWAYCGALSIDEDGRCLNRFGPGSGAVEVHSKFRDGLIFGNKIPGGCSTVLVSRSLFDDVGGFDQHLSMFADWELWVRLAEVADPAVWRGVGTLYLVHSEQMSLNHLNSRRELGYVRRKHADLRAALGPPRKEIIDRWVVQRFWTAGQRVRALRYGIVDAHGSLRVPSMVATIGGLQRERIKRRLGLYQTASAAAFVQPILDRANKAGSDANPVRLPPSSSAGLAGDDTSRRTGREADHAAVPLDDGADAPSVAVVMAAFNAAETILPQLEALADQTWAHPYEVVVVDNGSTDATADLVQAFADRHPMVRLVTATDRPSAGYARNQGAAATKAELLLFCDADDIVTPTWVEAMVIGLSADHMVGGVVEESLLNTPTVLQWKTQRDRSGLVVAHNFLPHAIGANVGLRAAVFEECGGWAECFPGGGGEDVELSWRVQLAGYRLGFVPDSEVHYRHRDSLAGLARQYYGRGRNGRLVCDAYRRFLSGPDQTVPDRAVTKASAATDILYDLWQIATPAAKGRVTRQLALGSGWSLGRLLSRKRFDLAVGELQSKIAPLVGDDVEAPNHHRRTT